VVVVVVVVVGMDVAGCAVSVALWLTEMRWVPISERRTVLSELAGVTRPDLSAGLIRGGSGHIGGIERLSRRPGGRSESGHGRISTNDELMGSRTGAE